MIPIGALANASAIIFGSIIGTLLHGRFPERIKTIVFHGLGLCILLLGLEMSLKFENILIILFSILLGSIIGELVKLDKFVDRLASVLKKIVRSKNPKFTDGLVNNTLISCIGAMAIIGSFDEGIRGDTTVLFSKSVIDIFASLALASTYGLGVLFAFIPVMTYLCLLTLFAGLFQSFFTPQLIAQITATGGLLTMAIGLSLLEIKEVKVINMLPALGIVVVLTLIFG